MSGYTGYPRYEKHIRISSDVPVFLLHQSQKQRIAKNGEHSNSNIKTTRRVILLMLPNKSINPKGTGSMGFRLRVRAIRGLGLRFQGFGFRMKALGFRLDEFGLWWGAGRWLEGVECWALGVGCCVQLTIHRPFGELGEGFRSDPDSPKRSKKWNPLILP